MHQTQEEGRRQSERIHLEKLMELGQVGTTEASQCQQRRRHQQKGVVPAGSRDAYMQEAAAPRGGDDMADRGEAIWGRRIALWSGPRPARSHPSSTLYFGIAILCTLINKAWCTYK